MDLQALPDAALRTMLDHLPARDACQLFAALPRLRAKVEPDYVCAKANDEALAVVKGLYKTALRMMVLLYEGIPTASGMSSLWTRAFGGTVCMTHAIKFGHWTVCGTEPLHTSFAHYVCRRVAAGAGDAIAGRGAHSPVGLMVAVANVDAANRFERSLVVQVVKMPRGSTDVLADKGPPLIDITFRLAQVEDRTVFKVETYAVHDWDSTAARQFAALAQLHVRAQARPSAP
jgi:hypothetical protein